MDEGGSCNLYVVVAQSSELLGGLLKQAFANGKAKKLLRETGARQRPQTCAGAAAKDDGGDLDHAF